MKMLLCLAQSIGDWRGAGLNTLSVISSMAGVTRPYNLIIVVLFYTNCFDYRRTKLKSASSPLMA